MYLFIWTILGSWSHGPILRRTGDVEAAEFRGKVCKGCNSTELLRFFVDEVVNWFCSGNSHSNFKYLVVFPYFPKQWTITGKHGKNMKTTVTFILFILLWCIIWARIEVYMKGAKTKAWRNNSHHIETRFWLNKCRKMKLQVSSEEGWGECGRFLAILVGSCGRNR